MELVVAEVDPLGEAALRLLQLAAAEARALYPESHVAGGSFPTNQPTPPGGVYLVATLGARPVGMVAHRPIDRDTTELRRMFVEAGSRRGGIARALLAKVEGHARLAGFSSIRLETGNRQVAAISLYESAGYVRIPSFGPYVNDPTSVCYERCL